MGACEGTTLSIVDAIVREFVAETHENLAQSRSTSSASNATLALAS